MYSTTEITSNEEISDNVIHQRLLFPYFKAADMIKGDVLEIGCGAGRGTQTLISNSKSYTAIDKNPVLIAELSKKYPQAKFLAANIPPLLGIPSSSFDTVVSFQVIEHIEDDQQFLQEIKRVLRPGGKLIFTTPNRNLSLTRNPWHIREYEAQELQKLCKKFFQEVNLLGIGGNEKIWNYYEENKKSVHKITRFDIFDLQNRLPRRILQVPYDILNRMNRKKLLKKTSGLVEHINQDDYVFSTDWNRSLDFFCVCIKAK
jgi:SAM-dependent methyltransferase